ncbi:MAG: phosphoribosylformylglycinamidine synthase subunit PurL [Candidatus Thermoplasmatota archaeon]|nr:phosphoribosylformylglycinamidine synthase subunit PurL [Candidatus Thermoplasmatota archaeon]
MPGRKRKAAQIVKLIGLDDSRLPAISKRMKLGLSADEMIMLKNYFLSLGRDPRDIEVHAMAQAWSEHCCYKSSKFYLKKYLSGLRQEYVILAMEDDAGVVEFDSDHVYVLKMESHNHPSAIEPYGGAATGVGGIIRDVLCMGAQPVALLDSLFFGDLKSGHGEGQLDQRFVFNRAVAGIRDYGNRMGIPTVAGSLAFDRSYSGNPLINAGCIGVARRKDIVRSRVTQSGDLLVVAGGKTGRDGIHGVNFASRSVSGKREDDIGSVQLGNPVTEEALTHAVLEAMEAGILDGMKDLGGGGLSSAVGELCYAGGLSAVVFLDRVPLKEEDMQPWEIWVSESQERMLMAISEKNLPLLDAILETWGLDHAVIARVKEGSNLVIEFHGETVLDLDLAFMTSGPIYCRNYTLPEKKEFTRTQPKEPADLNSLALEMLADFNICSREPVTRTYDFTVRGSTIVGPLTGSIDAETHSDAAVVKPLEDSFRGLVLTSDSRPIMVAGDPYRGTLNTLSEAYRNILVTGGFPHSVVDSMNFGNPEDPGQLGKFVESLRAIRDFCQKFSLPVVSGNVSLYNQNRDQNIKPTPVIFMTGIIDDVRKAIPSYFTGEGNSIYLIGNEDGDLSGSCLLHHLGYENTSAPFVDLDELSSLRKSMDALISNDVILAAHDISDGGLFVALAEMAFGRSIGASVDISETNGGRPINKLFAESGNRVLIEVAPEKEKLLSSLVTATIKKIGTTLGDRIVIENVNMNLIDVKVEDAKRAWSEGLSKMI